MPTSIKVFRVLRRELPSQIKGKIFDLGSGFGISTLFLSWKYPDNQVVGIELSIIPYIISRCVCFSRKNITILKGEISLMRLDSPGLVYCYLFPKGMLKVKEIGIRSIVVSNTFRIPETKYSKMIEVEDIYRSNLYFYDLN